MKKLVFILLILVFIIHLLFRIYEYRDIYTTKFDPKYYENLYNTSQWRVVDSKTVIGDDILYAYAAWEYINGRDPTTLNAELPPFGKYLIGFSEKLFQNQNVFALVSGIFALLAFYLLNMALFKDKLLAFIPVFLLSLEPLFYTNLRTALLDTLYLGLFCLVFYFLFKKKFILSAIILGLMAATKSSASTFITVIGASLFYFIITKQYINIKRYLFTLPITGVVFIIVYAQFFLSGHSFLEFLSVQKWVINFYTTGAKGSLTAPWELFFTGRFANWFGGQTIASEWHIGWLGALLLLVPVVFLLFKKNLIKQKNPIILLVIWTIGYLIFLSLIPLWPRYLLLVLPFMYTIHLYFFSKYIYTKVKSKK